MVPNPPLLDRDALTRAMRRRTTRRLAIIGAAFALLGALQFVGMRATGPPPLASLDSATGPLQRFELNMHAKHENYLTLFLGRRRLQIAADDDRLEAVAARLRVGDTLTVLSADSPIGSPGIWQIERHGRPIVRYEERRLRALASNARTAPVAWVVTVAGLAVVALAGYRALTDGGPRRS